MLKPQLFLDVLSVFLRLRLNKILTLLPIKVISVEMITVLHVLAVVFLFNFIESKAFRCDYTYSEEADGYLKFQEIPATWKEANVRCHLEGAKLASPLNEGLKSTINRIVEQSCQGCNIFTGIHATFSPGNFYSDEGIPLSRIPHDWTKDEPDSYRNNENCIILLPDGKMADVNCSIAFPYICYKQGRQSRINICGTSDNEYKLDTRTGSCYKFHHTMRNWSWAFKTCAAEGAHLVIINSELEAEVIKDIFIKNPPNTFPANIINKNIVYSGFHDLNRVGQFYTIHGNKLKEAGYSKFAPGEPSGGEFCGSILRNGLLNDAGCDWEYLFICEKGPKDQFCPGDLE